jgi:hypothetical protein
LKMEAQQHDSTVASVKCTSREQNQRVHRHPSMIRRLLRCSEPPWTRECLNK